MRKVTVFILSFMLLATSAYAARIKDVAKIAGVRSNQLVGYGLVTGLPGTGESTPFTDQSFTAMLHDRPNRPALTREEALNTLKENWGLRYDPELIKAFAEIIEEEIRTGESVKFDSDQLFDL